MAAAIPWERLQHAQDSAAEFIPIWARSWKGFRKSTSTPRRFFMAITSKVSCRKQAIHFNSRITTARSSAATVSNLAATSAIRNSTKRFITTSREISRSPLVAPMILAAVTSNPSNPAGSSDLYPDYLLGLPNSYTQGSGNSERIRSTSIYLFVQDSWKIKPMVTLNYG